MKNDLTELEAHFEFGRNWQEFVDQVGPKDIERGVESLKRLLPVDEIAGKKFFDIGSGSGMTILSALKMGASECRGIDIDPHSVSAAKTLLGRHAPDEHWNIQEGSVFDLDVEQEGLYDIVHSWGVLHHTGEMWRAIEAAAKRTAPGGKFVLAIYRKSPFCRLWTIEKRLYSRAPGFVQKLLRGVYRIFYFAGLLASGRNPSTYLANYHLDRGMDWHIDLHDWMGGYPYESVSASELTTFIEKLGFRKYREVSHSPALWGLFGTHCDEFVFEKIAA